MSSAGRGRWSGRPGSEGSSSVVPANGASPVLQRGESMEDYITQDAAGDAGAEGRRARRRCPSRTGGVLQQEVPPH